MGAKMGPEAQARAARPWRVRPGPGRRPNRACAWASSQPLVGGGSSPNPASHADFGTATHPGVGGGTHHHQATADRS